MTRSLLKSTQILLAGFLVALPFPSLTQELPGPSLHYPADPVARMYDSLVASRVPRLPVPAGALARTLPDSLDNSRFPWFPGILDQENFYSCQQYCGTAYTFAYEMNRLRDVDGTIPENRYAPHYMWHFFNRGERYVGVNFLHTFHAMMEQGHMTNADFGDDYAQAEKGWITGYDKYYRAMHNRLRNLYSIPVNSAEGILTVKQYLYDHLDGSASGGIVCFTTSSPQTTGPGTGILPPGSPEAGKYVITYWMPYPTHGMTLVGYHDSIRFDLNGDGEYTNHVDITGDGEVNAKDWEIGGFRAANSYGTWWADQGYFYILYRAMACGFEEGGVWNNCVYVVEPDPGYSPLLTLKIDLEHTRREQLNILAGVSTDPASAYPEYTLEPPVFSFQGGPHYMQGFDTLPELKTLEFGLDVTPLLSYLEPGTPARFFLVVEERDPGNSGQGVIHQASFIRYGSQVTEFPCTGTDIPVRHNGTTILSATGVVDFGFPVILNEELPPLSATGSCAVQLEAEGGKSPYAWNLLQQYRQTPGGAGYQPFAGLELTPQSSGKPFASVTLPFSFHFYGKLFQTIYVNAYGMIHFEPDHLPYPYLSSVTDMFSYIPALAPCFSWNWVLHPASGDGMWMDASADSVRFRWKVSVVDEEYQTSMEFGVTLFPDGRVGYCYGPAQLGSTGLVPWMGVSGGDPASVRVSPVYDLGPESPPPCVWIPPASPASVSVTRDGYLSIDGADDSTIYTLPVQVTDCNGIHSVRDFQLSDGLLISHALVSPSGRLKYQEPATLDLTLTNIASLPLGPVELTFSGGNPALFVTDSAATSGILAPSQSLHLSEAFAFRLEADLPDQTAIPCTIRATAPGKSWETNFFLTVAAPLIQVAGAVVHDGVNGLLDAGETAGLVVSVSNLGHWPAEDLTLTLACNDSLVQILSSTELTLQSLGEKGSYDAFYTLRASRNIPAGHLTDLTFQISNGSGIDLTWPFQLKSGINPIALIRLTDNTSSLSLMTAMLDSLGAGYDLHTTIPADLNAYPCALLLLGTSYPGSSILTPDEISQLAGFLNGGGNAYMESYATWYFGEGEMLAELFHYATDRVSVYNFNNLTGVEGTLTDGMAYPYEGSAPYAIFEVTPSGDGFSLMNNLEDPPRCVEFAYAGESYRTIGTFAEFGRLADSDPPSRKAILFRRYLDFLEVNLDGPFPFFHADTTHVCQWRLVQFTDDSFDQVTSWDWEFPGGDPAWSEEQNPAVQYHQAGIYDVWLTVSDGIQSHTMHKKQYIHVGVCTGERGSPQPGPAIRLYPNPTSSVVHLSFPHGAVNPVVVQVLDMQGRTVIPPARYATGADQPVVLNVSDLGPGIYLVRVAGDAKSVSAKLAIY